MSGSKRFQRLILSTILGAVAGIVCYLLSKDKFSYTPQIMWSTILNRTMIGFALGISGLKWPYFLTGIIVGAIISLPLSVPAYITNGLIPFLMITIAGAVYGLIIEIITSGIFKLKVKK